MGQEIQSEHFQKHDFVAFEQALATETVLLKKWFDEESFTDTGLVVGFELEAWLIDLQGRPAPVNASFLENLNDPLVVPELSCFNVEINDTPQPLQAGATSRLYQELVATWQRCKQMAAATKCETCYDWYSSYSPRRRFSTRKYQFYEALLCPQRTNNAYA